MNTAEQNAQYIVRLRTYLAHLPSSLPESSNPQTDFRHFAPKAGVLPGDKAVADALQEIKLHFIAENYTFRERGAGMQAFADVLERYLAQYPTSLSLQKWLYTAVFVAQNTYRSFNVPQVRYFSFISSHLMN